MKHIEIFTRPGCPYCTQAKQLLKQRGHTFEEHDVDLNPDKLREMLERSPQRTVPQIFIDGVAIGGFTDLVKLNTTLEGAD